jgi:cell division protein FtsI (penicillin-binding protein 3)
VADQPPTVLRATLKRRLALAFGFLMLWATVIEARLVYLQVVRYGDLSARAERQQARKIDAPAKRGDILDRHGHILAYSVDADTIIAKPNEISDLDSTIAAVCRALGDCAGTDRQAMSERIRKGKYFAYVRRQVWPDQAARVAALKLEGIGFIKESKRTYPNSDLASHVLGYVGIDNVGLSGIEATYDSLVRGRAGTVLVDRDARGQAFGRVERPPTAGASLELTIDEYLQHVAERELRAGVRWSGASGGSAIVMDPSTGEILALANAPDFNPNAYRDAREELRRNRAIQDLYEPGSTFKIVTASAAFEERAATPGTIIDARAGNIRFGSRVINDDHNYGVLSFADVIIKSSNVGAIKVALKLGPEKVGDYVKRFGFGRPTSPDFRGESPGIVWDPSKLTDSALASVAMGYQVGVTPLQMAAAVSAVANGGELVQPRVVRAVIRDSKRLPVPRKVVTRSITSETAATLTQIMGPWSPRAPARLRRSPDIRWQERRARRRSSSTAAIADTPTTTCRLSVSCRRRNPCSRSWSSSIRRTACRHTAVSLPRPSSRRLRRPRFVTTACRSRSIRPYRCSSRVTKRRSSGRPVRSRRRESCRLADRAPRSRSFPI